MLLGSQDVVVFLCAGIFMHNLTLSPPTIGLGAQLTLGTGQAKVGIGDSIT